MGLIGGLLSLPLAPARGLVWILDQAVEEAEAQLHDPRRIRLELAEAEAALERGELDPTFAHNAVATVVIGALRGIALEWLLAPEAVDIDAAYGQLRETLERSLTPAP